MQQVRRDHLISHVLSAIAEKIERAVRRGLARSHGRPTWQPALTATTGSQPTVLTVPDGTSVQVQLLGGEGYLWPTEVVEIEQRYSDAPPARLRVLTADAFAAAKLGAWIDRGAPRDLYDLWAMSERGLIGPPEPGHTPYRDVSCGRP